MKKPIFFYTKKPSFFANFVLNNNKIKYLAKYNVSTR